jgi:hypothetical protein
MLVLVIVNPGCAAQGQEELEAQAWALILEFAQNSDPKGIEAARQEHHHVYGQKWRMYECEVLTRAVGQTEVNMRYIVTAATLLVATAAVCAEDLPKAARVIDGNKTTYPEKTIRDGVRALRDVLEACHYMGDSRFENGKEIKYAADDVSKAQKGDHVRFVFSKPLLVDVLDKELDATEVVFANGAFWLVCGKTVWRCSKYEHEKMLVFEKWYRQTLPVD